MQNAIGVDVEGDFNLGHAARSGGNAFEVEFAQQFVARSHFTLALVHLDGHCRLVVFCSREGLGKLGRNRGVLGDHLGHDVAHRLDTERQWGYVQQQHVFAVAAQHLALNGGAYGHRFIGVDVFARLFAKEFLDLVLHLGHAGLAANEDDVGDVAHADACVLDGHFARLDAALNQIFYQCFELGAGQLDVEVFGAGCIGRDVGQVDVGGLAAGQLDLGFFGSFFQALQRQHVVFQINALFFFELGDHVVDDALVKVFTAQEGVAVGGKHLELFFAIHIGNLDDGYVKSAAAQVVHGDFAVAFFLLV